MSDVLDQLAKRFERITVEWNLGFGEWIGEVNQVRGYGDTAGEAALSAVRNLEEKQRHDQEKESA